MTSYAIIIAVAAVALSAIVAIVVFAIIRNTAQAKQLGRQEVINEVQASENAAIRKADVVLSERRTVDDTVKRLRDSGDF